MNGDGAGGSLVLTRTPVANGVVVLRSFKALASDGSIPLTAFEYADADAKRDGPNVILSVFQQQLTTPAQLKTFVPATHVHYCHLPVDAIRDLRPLDVVATPATLVDPTGVESLDQRPGHEGHAGITGMLQPDKNVRKELRLKLQAVAREPRPFVESASGNSDTRAGPEGAP